jgi:hypothetical protein
MGTITHFRRLQWTAGNVDQQLCSIAAFDAEDVKVVACHTNESSLGVLNPDNSGCVSCNSAGPRPVYTSSPTAIVKTSKVEINASLPQPTTFGPVQFNPVSNTLAPGEKVMLIIEVSGNENQS